MDEVTFLGTGFSLPTGQRHAISIHVNGARGLLVDAGGDPAKGLARAGHLHHVDAVLITHQHTDHTGGFAALVHALRFTERTTPLVVAAAPLVAARLQAACRELDATAPYGIEWVELDPAGGSVVLAGVSVETAPADHTVPALAVRTGGVTYSSDTRPAAAVVELARGADLLIHEATHPDAAFMDRVRHSTPPQAGDVARRAGAKALALVHLHPSIDAQVAADSAGFTPVWVPVDGDRLLRKGDSWALVHDAWSVQPIRVSE